MKNRTDEKNNTERRKKKTGMKIRRLSHVQIIITGYILMILLGTGLLMLPFMSRGEGSVGFEKAFFTAVSTSCVTGLTLCDTWTTWTYAGQAVLLVLIQTGGLGFMTIATFFFALLRKRMGLYSRETMVESINTTHVGGIMRLSKVITLGTLAFEACGALLLSVRFIPEYGVLRGIWFSVFHSISAFCNAGFDLMGINEEYSSFTAYSGDFLVCLTLMALIQMGALGFIVWQDVAFHGLHIRKYSLHTKVVLVMTMGLFAVGTVLFFLFERNATGAGLGTGERMLTAAFAAVTPRTAGFNTVDIAKMSESSRLLTVIYMLTGGSPGSTAGGIKTTTVFVIFAYMINLVRGRKRTTVFHRTIPDSILKKALVVAMYNISLALIATLIICGIWQLPVTDILFECFSAIDTVGMTTGITRSLTGGSKYIIAFLMFLGRVGSVSFAVALIGKKGNAIVEYPAEDVTVG